MKPAKTAPMEELSLDLPDSPQAKNILLKFVPAIAFILSGILVGYLVAYMQGRDSLQAHKKQVIELKTQVEELRNDLATAEKYEKLLRQAVTALKENSIARSKPRSGPQPEPPKSGQVQPAVVEKGDAAPLLKPEKIQEPEAVVPQPFALKNGECQPAGKTPAEQAAGFMACIDLLNESDPARKSAKHKQVP